MVSIETVAPLHDSVLAERARSAVEILLQETPGLNLWPPVTLGTLTLLISLQDLDQDQDFRHNAVRADILSRLRK